LKIERERDVEETFFDEEPGASLKETTEGGLMRHIQYILVIFSPNILVKVFLYFYYIVT
jgi:hypothetical protein